MKTIKYSDGHKYNHRLEEAYCCRVPIRPAVAIITPFICLTTDGWLYIERNYAWDGATMFPDIRSIRRGSLVHDALYQLIRMGLLPELERLVADQVLHQICIEDGMWRWVAAGVLAAVERFGGPAADPKKVKKVKEAP